MDDEEPAAVDARSVYIGNVRVESTDPDVQRPYPSMRELSMDLKIQADRDEFLFSQVDYGATPEEIQAHFQACGTINRITILCDKFTGHPKGSAFCI